MHIKSQAINPNAIAHVIKLAISTTNDRDALVEKLNGVIAGIHNKNVNNHP